MSHNRIIQLFNQQFQDTENTVLCGNADEPLYQPAEQANQPHRIYFSNDYASSALHEIAHWTLAGAQRRQQVDYGYWYAPDGRDTAQQSLFEQVEVKPQAIEWIFSLAADIKFNISADNLDANLGASDHFKRAVWCQAVAFLDNNSLPPRAALFTQTLLDSYRPGCFLESQQLTLATL